MRRDNEHFKERMRKRQARAKRLYRVGAFSVMLGIGLAYLGIARML